jgi:2-polyprenyl-3-methyl-5-hydroxy-6-metoxy-1,4-benzoquinol methylase
MDVDSPDWLHGNLAANFPEVHGIDVVEEKISILNEKGFEKVRTASAETFSIPLKFDTIVAGELIEHLSNPGLFLAKAKDHLAADGRIVITTPYPFSILYGMYAVARYPRTCFNPEHTAWFCPQTLMELTRRSGLTVEHWELVQDYGSEHNSIPYVILSRVIKYFGFLIPKRLKCNTMLFVLRLPLDMREVENHEIHDG